MGAIFTNDDTAGTDPTHFFPLSVLSSVNGDANHIYRHFQIPPTLSENGGDVLADGTFRIAADYFPALQRYSGQMALLNTVTGIVINGASCVRTCLGQQVWYVGHCNVGADTGTRDIAKVDATGTVVDHWNAVNLLQCVAASNDGSLIYVARSDLVNTPLQRFVTATNSYTTNLAGAIGTTKILDLLVLGDDTICALYNGFAGGFSLDDRHSVCSRRNSGEHLQRPLRTRTRDHCSMPSMIRHHSGHGSIFQASASSGKCGCRTGPSSPPSPTRRSNRG